VFLENYFKPGEDILFVGRNFIDMNRPEGGRVLTIVDGAPAVEGDSPIFPFTAPVPLGFSLTFNGTDEHMTGSFPDLDLGSVDAFSVMGWTKYDLSAGSTFDVLWRATAVSGAPFPAGANSIDIQMKTPVFAQANGRIQIEMKNTAGSEYKDLEWNDVIPNNTWVHFVFTYNGSLGADPVTLYIDGVDQGVADTIVTDGTGTQDNSITRVVEIGSTLAFGGSEWPGIYHQAAIWSNAITSAEVTSIYNSGTTGFDLLVNSGSYVSEASLLHWWRLGDNASDIGEDTGNHVNLQDLTGVNMDVTNRVQDSP